MNDLLARLAPHSSARVQRIEPQPLRPILTAAIAAKRRDREVQLLGDASVVGAGRRRWRSSRRSAISSRTPSTQAAARAGDRPGRPATTAASPIAIGDKGVGMDGDFVRNRLFQPFASTKPGGFGIGAFEARSLIAAMGGRLSVDSRPGRGTTFTIFLPAAEPAAEPTTETRMTDEPAKVLLVVEDDEGLQRQLKWAYDGYEVVCAGDRASAIEALRAYEPAVVTLDLGLPPDPDGTDEGFADARGNPAAEARHQGRSSPPATAPAKARSRRSRMGAYDFYKKPVDIDELGLIVARAFHLHEIEEENRRLESGGGATVLGSIITAAPEMLKVAKTIERVASADVSVMLLGASGTGKELLARAVHEKSGRKGEFIAINCAAIPENLLEAELFGYERGAFTGAVKSNVGKIELAAGRHPVPRRGRRHPAAAAGQAAALPAGAGDRAHRRAPADRGRHAHRLRHPPGSRCDDRRRPFPRGPLLPPRRNRREDPVARRAFRRRGAARAALHQPLRPRAEPGRQSLSAGRGRRRSTPTAGRATSASSRTASSAR